MCEDRLGESKLDIVYAYRSQRILFLNAYSTKCRQGFRSKNLEEEESKCVTGCAEKYMKLAQRVGFRLGEYQAVKAQEMQQSAKR